MPPFLVWSPTTKGQPVHGEADSNPPAKASREAKRFERPCAVKRGALEETV